VAERVVGDLVGEALPVVPGEPRLLREVAAGVRKHLLAKTGGVEAGVEKTRAEYADDGKVNAVLEFRERVVATGRRTRGSRGGKSLVKIHA
jgi:hypothetical protein